MRIAKTLTVVIATTALLHCAGAKPRPTEDCGTGPAWTCFKSGPCPIPELSGSLCAVGSVDQVQSMSLAGQAASTRARTEIAAVIQSQVDGFTRAVQDSLSKQGVGDDSVQKIGDMAQNVVKATLSGVTIPKTYFNKEERFAFALAAIDVKTLASGLKDLKEARGLSEATKKEIERRADLVVEDWERERSRLDSPR